MTKEDFKKIVTGLGNIVEEYDIHDDNDFDSETQKQIIRRDEQYSDLLEHFVWITKERNYSKEKNKWVFFRIIMALLIILNVTIVTIIIVLLVKCNSKELLASIPVFITAITGFASSIIAIPLSITKYLFSTQEDEYITKIISHTQEHDSSGRKILKDIINVSNDNE